MGDDCHVRDCVHGMPTSDGSTCVCNDGWTGDLCDQADNTGGSDSGSDSGSGSGSDSSSDPDSGYIPIPQGNETCTYGDLWNGAANTQKIVAQLGDAALAAKAATQFYSPGTSAGDANFGAGKWYLPAIGELMEMYGINYGSITTSANDSSGATGENFNLLNEALTIMEGKNSAIAKKFVQQRAFWSSTEVGSDKSWMLHDSDGGRYQYEKKNSVYVRLFNYLENKFDGNIAVADIVYNDLSYGKAEVYNKNGNKQPMGIVVSVYNNGTSVKIMTLKELSFTNADLSGNFDPTAPFSNQTTQTRWATDAKKSENVAELQDYDSETALSTMKSAAINPSIISPCQEEN